MRTRRWALGLLGVVLGAGCGARTGLLDDAPPVVPEADASVDGGADASPLADASPVRDASVDAVVREDAAVDAREDVDADAREDADAELDADANPDVFVEDCKALGVTYIYVVTQTAAGVGNLYAFDPSTLTFRFIATLHCLASPGATPFSMAVDREGRAYVEYSDGSLFRVSTLTGSCQQTGYSVDPDFTNFGMSFATDLGGPSETLYVATGGLNATGTTGDPNGPQLGSINSTSFQLDILASLSPSASDGMELTGTGDGRLFGFVVSEDSGTFVVQIDKKTGAFSNEVDFVNLPVNSGWAFGFWGGDFYFFTGSASGAASSIVTRYHPADGPQGIKQVASLDELVVGAGVSTCAPEE